MRTRSIAKVVDHQGLTVHVEFPVGTTREGTDPEGKPFVCQYSADYGFLRHSDGTRILGDDGEDYDAFLGSSPASAAVHVVTQVKAPSGAYDEQKAILGCDSAEEATALYKAHRPASMFGGIASLTLDDFNARLAAHRAEGDADASAKTTPFRPVPVPDGDSAANKYTAEGNTTAPVQPPHSETQDMSDAAPRTKDAAGAATPNEGGAVHRPSGLCVRAAELSAVREDAREVDFVCSTEAVDSYGEIVKQTWDLKRFSANPVALWSHQSHELPIGYWKNVRVDGGALRGTLVVADARANPKAENVWQGILQKTIRAVSVGFLPHKVSYEEVDGDEVCVLDENELFEISVTPIPANPEALGGLKAKALEAYRSRGAVPFKDTPLASSTKWDASAAMRRIRIWASSDGSGSSDHINWTKYREAFAWLDTKRSHEFGGYKLPHHDIENGKLVVNRQGVIAACDAVDGARGGVKIPEADMPGVKSHLQREAHKFDMKAPWEADKSTSAPTRGTITKEARVGATKSTKDKITCPGCGEEFDPEDEDNDGDGDETKSTKNANRALIQKKVGAASGAVATERDAASERAKAADKKVSALETENASLHAKMIEAELAPLSGVKFPPAAMQGHVDLAAHYRSQGEDGAKKWKAHLDALKSAPDLKLLGASPLPADPTPNGLTTSTAPAGNELAALVNDEAAHLG